MANVMVIGPHPDDQELAMGGTIALLAAQGHDVLLLDVTNGEPTPYGDVATRAAEAARAAAILSPDAGAGPPVRRRLLGLPNRSVVHSLEARHLMAGAIRAHQAQVLFVPYPEDAHPDHLAVTRIASDARFDAKLTKVSMPGDEGRPPIYAKWLFYYYATHLRLVPQPTFIMDVSAHVRRRMEACAAYESQFAKNPLNAGILERIHTTAAYFGGRIGTAAGEPFWTPEPPGLTGLGCFVA